MSTIRDAYEQRLGAAWREICDGAGMKHDGLYNIETQSPEFARKIGELMFKYMTDMGDSTDGVSTRGVHEIALFFEDVAAYAKHSD